MRRIFGGMLLILGFFNVNAQNFNWAKKGGLWAYDYGYGITTDNMGRVYVAGKYEQNANFSGTVLPCQGNHDIFVAQYSSGGTLNWIRTAGGYTGDYATAIATDGNNYVYIAGEIEGKNATIKFPGSSITLTCQGSNDIFLAKYTLSGTLLWARRAGGYDYEKALGITTDNNGNIFMCGLFRGTVKFGSSTYISSSGNNDIFVAKYDANGNFLWVKKAGSSQRDEAKSIVCDYSGNVYITGLYKNGCNFGSTTLYGSNMNAFVAKYSSSGSLIWVKQAGGTWDDVGWSIAIDKNAGRLYVGGEFNASTNFGNNITLNTTGSADAFVACYDLNGTTLWAKKAGGSKIDRIRGIGFANGNIYMTGQFGSSAYFGPFTKYAADNSDIFMACMNTSGNFLWVSTVGGPADAAEDLGYESGNAICGDNSGNVYATGAMLTGGKFGNITVNGYTRTDVFVTKLSGSAAGKMIGDSLVVEDAPLQKFDLADTTVTMLSDNPSSTEELVTLRQNEQRLTGKEMMVYPNPGTGNFKVDLLQQSDKLYEMRVMNASGQVIEKKSFYATDQIEVDLTGYEKGIYFIELKVGEALFRQKVVLQ